MIFSMLIVLKFQSLLTAECTLVSLPFDKAREKTTSSKKPKQNNYAFFILHSTVYFLANNCQLNHHLLLSCHAREKNRIPH